MAYSNAFMLFDATPPNALRQSYIRESAHLQRLLLHNNLGFVDNQFQLF